VLRCKRSYWQFQWLGNSIRTQTNPHQEKQHSWAPFRISLITKAVQISCIDLFMFWKTQQTGKQVTFQVQIAERAEIKICAQKFKTSFGSSFDYITATPVW
jgi:hypothetical protein